MKYAADKGLKWAPDTYPALPFAAVHPGASTVSAIRKTTTAFRIIVRIQSYY